MSLRLFRRFRGGTKRPTSIARPQRGIQQEMAASRGVFFLGCEPGVLPKLLARPGSESGLGAERGAPVAAGGSSSSCASMAAEVGWPVHKKTASRPNQRVPGASPGCGEARVGGGEARGGVRGLP